MDVSDLTRGAPGPGMTRQEPAQYDDVAQYYAAAIAVSKGLWRDTMARNHVGIATQHDLHYRWLEYGDRVEAIDGWNTTDAFRLMSPDGHSEFWVNVDLKKKRYTQAWIDYLEVTHGVRNGRLDDHDLDHLCSVAVARRRGLNFVRLTPVLSSVNRAWGGGVERRRNPHSYSVKTQVLADYFVFAKMTGHFPPSFSTKTNLFEEAEKFIRRLELREAISEADRQTIFAFFEKIAAEARDYERLRKERAKLSSAKSHPPIA